MNKCPSHVAAWCPPPPPAPRWRAEPGNLGFQSSSQQIAPKGPWVSAVPLLHNSHISLQPVTPAPLEEGNLKYKWKEFSRVPLSMSASSDTTEDSGWRAEKGCRGQANYQSRGLCKFSTCIKSVSGCGVLDTTPLVPYWLALDKWSHCGTNARKPV